MIRNCTICILVTLFMSGCILSNHYINIAKITVKVIDEDGNAIKGAYVGIGSFIGADSKKTNSVNGLTDENGYFTATLSGTNGYSVSARKEKYYGGGLGYDFKGFKCKRWLPWNPEISIVLYKIGDRVPMYAHDTEYSKIEIPAIGKQIGFDLIKFDWVRPYGKGVCSDMIFKLDKQFSDRNSFRSKLTVSFSNRYDGIRLVAQKRRIGNGLKMARSAPEEGYQIELSHFIEKTPNTPLKSSFNEDSNYFFRVRSEVNNGKLVRAMYGKIYGDIVFEPRSSKTASILFKYFLNPNYTKDMEFDPQRNLFTGLSNLELNGLN